MPIGSRTCSEAMFLLNVMTVSRPSREQIRVNTIVCRLRVWSTSSVVEAVETSRRAEKQHLTTVTRAQTRCLKENKDHDHEIARARMMLR